MVSNVLFLLILMEMFFSVRLSDLAVVQVRGPYLGTYIFPYIPIATSGNSSGWINMDPTIGKVDPKLFAIPSGQCTFLPYGGDDGDFFGFSAFQKTPNVNEMVSGFMDQLSDFFFTRRAKKSRDVVVRKQTPPTLAQSFTAQFTLTYNDTYYSPKKLITFAGELAFDFSKSGFYFMIDAVDTVPFSVSTGFILYPDRGGLEFLWVNPERDAYSIVILPWIITLLFPTYTLPPDAIYAGETVINGDRCSMWNMAWTSKSTSVWVRESDGAIVKAKNFQDINWIYDYGTIELSDIQLSVDPSLYQRPKTVANLMTWSHDFQSHLSWYWCEPFC